MDHRALLSLLTGKPTRSSNPTTMAPTGKAKAVAAAAAAPTGEDGKLPFNSSAEDFPRLMSLMQQPNFFTTWHGAKTFYKHNLNKLWREKYSESSWSNGWNSAKKKYMDSLVANPSADPEEDEDCLREFRVAVSS